MTLLYGTQSTGKLDELRRLAPRLAARAQSLKELGIAKAPEEEHETFEENAKLKASHYAQASGLPTLADDSGICIDALDGRPGVHSARFMPERTDEERNLHLARTIGSRPASERGATFVCALALCIPGADLLSVQGEVRGEIAPEPRGGEGFGYDPIFLVPQLGKTFAELPAQEKDLWSHRGHAFAALLSALNARADVLDLLLA